MDWLTRSELRTLLAEHDGPCVSIYMPAHRGGAEQDPIRFVGLVGDRSAPRTEPSAHRHPFWSYSTLMGCGKPRGSSSTVIVSQSMGPSGGTLNRIAQPYQTGGSTGK
jgi:hypothetical protein